MEAAWLDPQATLTATVPQGEYTRTFGRIHAVAADAAGRPAHGKAAGMAGSAGTAAASGVAGGSGAGVGVPALNLVAGMHAYRDALLRELTAICDSGQYILGERVARFEAALADYCGARHALGVSSGTDALLLAMMTLGIGPGDEVIVPTFTFFASGGCVARLGAKPVFCDIDESTFNIDVARIEPLITPRTRAIMPVHLYGQLADMPGVRAVAKRHSLRIIEDAAQAIGARLAASDRRGAGAFGDLNCLSFYPTKNLGAIGDAGMLLTDDDALFERARLLRTHGESPKYYHHMIGGNFRIDALQAAILHVKLPHLEDWTARRREVAARYRTLFAQAELPAGAVRLPVERCGSHVYHQFVLRVERRDALLRHLAERKIGCGVYYPVPLHVQKCFAYLGGKLGDCPVAERIASEVLALPMYPELTEVQQQAVVAAIAEFFRE
ncbi:MAG: dTDP-3-amino-3,4,6-trideoxy-alpha-D-glucose transaminase [Phycisphaerae bacterium]|nr:dTDP-3-amino-3,4,6-trideoxy-alpha-D-glucose transaminase [Phycisphaerae bacterium]